MEQKQNNTPASSGGIGLFGLTFIVLLVLKLTVRQDLSWWWVTAPLWGPLVVALALLALGGAIMGIGYLGIMAYFKIKESLHRRRMKRRQDEWVRSMKGD